MTETKTKEGFNYKAKMVAGITFIGECIVAHEVCNIYDFLKEKLSELWDSLDDSTLVKDLILIAHHSL